MEENVAPLIFEQTTQKSVRFLVERPSTQNFSMIIDTDESEIPQQQ